MSIVVKNLTKTFGSQIAVNNISFEIKQGSIVGFLGPNGAGKSTTMKMITSYISPDSGSIQVCGYDVASQSIETRLRIGYMPESNPLYFDMYVREFLEFASGIHRLGTKSKSRIDEMIAMVGLTKEVKKKIGTLSKGYKQRVGLAQAMLHNPDVLILDEPTSGLDPNQLVDIRNVIKEIGKEKTVLLSTHIMQEVEAMCSRVIIINNGNVVADDTIDKIQTTTVEKLVTLSVQFDKVVATEALQQLNNVTNVLSQNNNEWLIQTDKVDYLRKELMTWAVKNDIIIQSMQVSTERLEDVFRKLTQK